MFGSFTNGEINVSYTAALVKRITQLSGTTTSVTATITTANTQPDPNYAFFDFSAFNGNATNGAQGGFSPVNQPDPSYVSYDSVPSMAPPPTAPRVASRRSINPIQTTSAMISAPSTVPLPMAARADLCRCHPTARSRFKPGLPIERWRIASAPRQRSIIAL